MKAAEFNAIYEKRLIRSLVAAGFVQQNRCLFFIEDFGVLALMRYQNKWSSMLQFTIFTVCVRHTFLRDLLKKATDQFDLSISNYPFKIQPSRLTPDFTESGWRYEPCNLGHWPKDEFEYGQAR